MDTQYAPVQMREPLRLIAAWLVLTAAPMQPLLAGGYVDGSMTLNSATTVSTPTSPTPAYNNAQFTNKLLVGAVNNDPIKTPSTNDPVSTVSGNNYHDEIDFQIKGVNGLNFMFTRTYNSSPTAAQTDVGLGVGWVHSYGMKLVSNDFGQNPNSSVATNSDGITSSITYTDERGAQQNFPVTYNTYAVTNPMGEFDTLTLNAPVAGQHTLTFRNGTQYIFQDPTYSAASDMRAVPGKPARLIKIQDPYGNALSMGYTGNNLTSITDNLNRKLVLAYNADTPVNHLQGITDWMGRQWVYTVQPFSSTTNGTVYALWGADNPFTLTYVNYHRTYQYSPQTHLLLSVTKPLTRNGPNNTPLSVGTSFQYYQNGKTFNDQDSLANTETLDYDLYRLSTRVTDPRGGVREYNYDTNGGMTKLTEADGGVLFFNNQSDGLRYQKYDALGYGTTYSYRSDKSVNTASDNGGNVSLEQDALNNTIATTYGPYDQVATVKDKRGNIITTSFYNSTSGCALNGKPQAVTISSLGGTANVKLRDYCWNSNGTLHSQNEYLDVAGKHIRTTTFTYDTSGLNITDVNVTATNTATVIHTHYIYDNLGRKTSESLTRTTSITNPATESLATTYVYDALDRAIRVQNPEGRIQETVYDLNDQVAQENTWYPSTVARAGCGAPAIPSGYTTSFVICTEATHQYDAADRRISTTDILGKDTKFAYDPSGNLISHTDLNGHTTTFEYDAMNRKTAVIDANGRRTQTVYNQRGDAVSVTNDNGETVKSQYDALGRLTQVTDNLGYITQYKYDANGNQTCIIDANEHSVTTDPSYQPLNTDNCTATNSYDELNRLISSKDAQGNVTAYAYDLLGNRTAVKDANGHTTTFAYDDLGRLVSMTDPLNGANSTESYVNDEAGNVIQMTDRKGQISQHFYDVLNRKTQSSYLADSTQGTYTYDNFDDLRQAQNNAVTYSYAYDTKHRLQSKTDSRQNLSLSWTFDPAGNIKTKTDYQGNVTSYQYDNSNRLTAETNPNYLEVSYHYDDAGRLLDRILSNGARSHYVYDGGGRLTRLTNTTVTNGVVNDTQYTRDHIGNILTAIESTGTSQAAGTSTFKYDAEYRLTAATYPTTMANNETITYDPAGNRKTYGKGSLTLYYNVNAANRLIDTRTGSATGTVYESYGYDNNGSMTGISGNRTIGLTWDAHNRISQMQVNTIPAYSFQYDPSGYRIQKNAGSMKNYYLQAEHLEAVYDNNNKLLGQFFRGSVIDEVVNAYMPDSTGKLVNYTYHHDALESVLGQSGHDGTVLSGQGYTAFGSTVNASGSSNNMLKYTGREQDTETGFYYYRARYYDLIVGGRFLSEDPKGFGAGVNFYTYCGNNPINCNDPSGEVANLFAALGGGIIGGISGGATAYVKSNGDINATLKGGLFGAGFGAWTGATFGSNLVSTSALSGILSSAGGNAFGQFFGNQGNINLTEVGVNGLFGSVPGAIQSALINDAVLSGIGQNAINATAALATIGQFKLAGQATTEGLSSAFPAYNIDLSNQYNQVQQFTNSITNTVTSYLNSAAANGGFVLYPNKPNTNMMQSVYKK